MNTDSTPQGEDRTPDHVFIGVHPRRFRDLVKRCGLTRTEAAELLFLGLRINERRTCFPSNKRAADDANRKSHDQVRRLHKQLRAKGALDWEEDPAGGSHIFKLPDAFFYGSDSYHESKSRWGGTSKSTLSESRKVGGGGDIKPAPKQIQGEDQPDLNYTRPKQQQHPGSEGVLADELQTFVNREQAKRDLMAVGVREYEADRIARQYSTTTIYSVLHSAQQRSDEIHNPGAWVRKSIELRAGELIQFPNGKKQQQQGNKYLQDEYFSKHGAESDDDQDSRH